MKLIVGLGNPGEEYAQTRHNFGFFVVDELQKVLKGSAWKRSKKHTALISEVEWEGERIVLMKPQTFMNLSGEAVHSCQQFYKIDATNVWIIHDDKDLPLGTVRIRISGSSAGHNGVKSIMEHVGTDKFVRFRLGIATPSLATPNRDTTQFVLEKFRKEEWSMVQNVVKKVVEVVRAGLRNGIEPKDI